MTKLLPSALVLGLVFAVPLGIRAYEPLLAQTPGRAEVRTETRANINLGAPERTSTENRPGLMRARANAEVRAEIKAEAEKKWKENRSDENSRVKAHAHWMTKRFAVVIERLEILADRIEARIEKLNDEGVDTSVAVAFVADARAELANASEGFITLSADLDATIESGNWNREVFQELRTLAAEIKTDIKEAHQFLMNAVRSLKAETTVDANISTNTNVEVQ
jgi:Mg2+ and Co2+ transporter CorA